MWGPEARRFPWFPCHFLLSIYSRILDLRLKGKQCPQQARRCPEGVTCVFLLHVRRQDFRTLSLESVSDAVGGAGGE